MEDGGPVEWQELIETARRHGYDDAIEGKPLDAGYSWNLEPRRDAKLRSAYQRGFREGRSAMGQPAIVPRQRKKKRRSSPVEVQAVDPDQAAQILKVFGGLEACRTRLARYERLGSQSATQRDLAVARRLVVERQQLEARLIELAGTPTLATARRVASQLSEQAARGRGAAKREARQVAWRAAGPGHGPNGWAGRVKGGSKSETNPLPWVRVLHGGLPGQGKRS